MTTTMTNIEDRTDDPGLVIETATTRVLTLARTWLAWDGKPRLSEDGERIYTPHKVIRRYADHLVDHLAQIEALLAGVPTRPNGWRESRMTTVADFARFTEGDLNEAVERLTRLSRTIRLRLLVAGPSEWDRPRDGSWTLREIAEHVGSSWYAEQLGDLSSPPPAA
ncbi:hypothetical protein GCM10011492_27980 [Flexivirga endophytica]|uniref:DinB family protein n=1 Tax=Flexivirga endophytica TaxID=1849103 RepID=A0A916WUR6_9MICO|nr:hypothetical protein [Flexivirga endophytica]GGB35716.1 hypothetical protein GCM10011492_27980 [Flexivirga endophytica]